MAHPFVEIYDSYKKQHGNTKNGDIKRLSKLLNTTWVKERWFLLVLVAVITADYVRRENNKHNNEERRKEEIHQAQMEILKNKEV